MDTATQLEVPANAGRNTRKFFSGAIALAEKEQSPITVALRTYQQLHPKEFLAYLVEQGIISEQTAADMGGSR